MGNVFSAAAEPRWWLGWLVRAKESHFPMLLHKVVESLRGLGECRESLAKWTPS